MVSFDLPLFSLPLFRLGLFSFICSIERIEIICMMQEIESAKTYMVCRLMHKVALPLITIFTLLMIRVRGSAAIYITPIIDFSLFRWKRAASARHLLDTPRGVTIFLFTYTL